MNHYEKDLLTRLNTNNKTDSFTIQVRRIFTDVDGAILDKNTVPTNLKVKYPIYLWNGFDHSGGYKISAGEAPPLDSYKFVRMFVKNDAYDFTEFSGRNELNKTISTGDLVFLYADDLDNPTYFIWIIQSVTNRSLGSILTSIPECGFKMNHVKIFTDNTLSFNERLGIIKTNHLGVYKYNQISPLAFKTVDYQETRQILVPLKLRLTHLIGFVSYFPFVNESISFDFEFLNIS